jgi:hypothetical protein
MKPLGDDVLVVSGLPRSGTSLAMQLLAAGGVPVLSDRARGADEHNPRGYLELEAVKATARDARWVERARGHAVKVVLPLLELLPAGPRCRVILVTRDPREVALSQARMIGGDEATHTDELEAWAQRLGRDLDRGRRWLAARPATPVLELDHGELLSRPRATARHLRAFVGVELDTAAMLRVVDPALYRSRWQARAGTPGERTSPSEDT